mgnify:CR=1 FL=1
MNEFSLKDILGEAYDMEFSQYDKPPKHRFSLKHRKNMKRIFALENAGPQFSGKARLNRRTACVLAAVIFLAVVSITAVAGGSALLKSGTTTIRSCLLQISGAALILLRIYTIFLGLAIIMSCRRVTLTK